MANNGNGNKYHDNVIEYAKELYLTPKPDGGHLYTLRQIAEMVGKQFPDLSHIPDHTTIHNWTKRKSITGRTWRQLWNEGTIKGVIDANDDIKEINAAQSQEEEIADKIAMFNRRLSLIGMDLIVKGYKFFSDPEFVPEDEKQAIQMIKQGNDIYKTQAKEVDAMEDKVVNVIFKRAEKRPMPVELLPPDTLEINGVSDSPTNAVNGRNLQDKGNEGK